MTVAAVVLAAGGSTRFGRPKPLLRLAGRSLVQRAVLAAREGGCARVVAVLGADAAPIRAELAGAPADVVLNAHWAEGVASSIRAGLAAIENAGSPEAVLILVCDQPRLDAAIVRRVIEVFDGTPRGIAACAYAGTLGVPALFGRAWFGELSALHGASGAKPLLLRHASRVVRVDWPDGAVDIDTPEQWTRFAGGKGS